MSNHAVLVLGTAMAELSSGAPCADVVDAALSVAASAARQVVPHITPETFMAWAQRAFNAMPAKPVTQDRPS